MFWVEMIKIMKKSVKKSIGICGSNVRDVSGTREDFGVVSWGSKKEVESLCSWIYKDATLFLKRKRDIFLNAGFQCGV